ncbi:hypothetical protein JTE90_012475 [Oedothorax gibbosus]|uniref:Uncharacterized protein n=1 Tax=Oedothorax gibbosus TaxID=931172 RepID=A0AAV6UCD4_9ARAC|nr:hypothetical protein JTE90_012475 [Oedothorax gibbosus]
MNRRRVSTPRHCHGNFTRLQIYPHHPPSGARLPPYRFPFQPHSFNPSTQKGGGEELSCQRPDTRSIVDGPKQTTAKGRFQTPPMSRDKGLPRSDVYISRHGHIGGIGSAYKDLKTWSYFRRLWFRGVVIQNEWSSPTPAATSSPTDVFESNEVLKELNDGQKYKGVWRL